MGGWRARKVEVGFERKWSFYYSCRGCSGPYSGKRWVLHDDAADLKAPGRIEASMHSR